MMLRMAVSGLLFFGFAAAATPALSLTFLHDKRVEGGKVCFSDHEHLGEGEILRSKRAAMASAVRDWTRYTAGEYGAAWGSFKLSASKQASCRAVGGAWECYVRSRPCRRK